MRDTSNQEEVKVQEQDVQVEPNMVYTEDELAAVSEEVILGKDDFITELTTEAATEIVNGAQVRGLTGEEYRKLQGMRTTAAQAAGPQGIEDAFRIAEAVGFLTFGVVKPKLEKEEWQRVLRNAPHRKINAIVEAVQRLTGVGTFEQDFVKNALREIDPTVKSSGSD